MISQRCTVAQQRILETSQDAQQKIKSLRFAAKNALPVILNEKVIYIALHT
jgi:hypothetical protein